MTSQHHQKLTQLEPERTEQAFDNELENLQANQTLDDLNEFDNLNEMVEDAMTN
jgi:hypothetical protein